MKLFSYPDFSKARVLVVGDIMLDRYWHGDTSRISPEAPVPVVKIERIEDRLGGAANVAVNLSTIGVKTILAGVVGKDEAGDKIYTLLKEQGVQASLIRDDIKSITKLRVIGRSQQLIRCDFEDDHSLYHEALLNEIQKHLADIDVIVLSDYAKGTLNNPQAIIEFAKQYHLPVLVDPKSKDFSIYRGADMLTPNKLEFETAAGTCSNENMAKIASKMIKDMELNALLITQGAKGMTLFEREQAEGVHVPAMAKEVFDITGAGDTVIAIIAASLGAGSSRVEAIKLANLAASISVSKLGTSTVLPEELFEAWQTWTHAYHEEPILAETLIKQKVLKAKAKGEKIVMTNGCFDILHAGHIRYLQEARALGDRLIVAVNDDLSVKRLKGAARPIYPLEQRMQILASLSCVDWVVAFSEDTPARIIENLIPDILVKGGDYKVEDVVGGAFVKAQGKEVVILEFVPGCSTTSTLEKLEQERKAEYQE